LVLAQFEGMFSSYDLHVLTWPKMLLADVLQPAAGEQSGRKPGSEERASPEVAAI